MNEIKAGVQVRFREKLRNCNRILYGTVASLTENDTALISIQGDPRGPRTIQSAARREVPIRDLEVVSKVFGRATVQPDPNRRNIGYLLQK